MELSWDSDLLWSMVGIFNLLITQILGWNEAIFGDIDLDGDLAINAVILIFKAISMETNNGGKI